jgi:hypothetical protein
MKETFKNEIPQIQQELSELQAPLCFHDIVHIYKWIFRSQIAWSDLKPEIQADFMKTEQYEALKRENKL